MLMGCLDSKKVAYYSHYNVSDEESSRLKGAKYEVEIFPDSIYIYSQRHIELKPQIGFDESLDVDSIKYDTVFHERNLLKQLYWSVDKNGDYVIYKTEMSDFGIFDTLKIDQEDSTVVQDIPFYYSPSVSYFQVLHVERRKEGSVIYAKYEGIEDIFLEGDSVALRAHKFKFDYYNFKFSEFKPDYMYFNVETFHPLRLEYNYFELMNDKTIAVSHRKIEIDSAQFRRR